MKGPASAGPFRVGLAVALAVAVAMGGAGCKRGKPAAQQSGSLPERLGAAPAIIDPSATTAPGSTDSSVLGGGGGGGGAGGGGTTGRTTATTRGAGGGTTATTKPLAPFHSLASTTDRAGDAGLEAPGYDDFTAVRVEDNGDYARFTVEFAADVPPTLAAGEVMGVGVDIYRGGAESDFQVFADGGDEGWRAYLQSGKQLVKYEGTFELGGNRLVFTVPWSAIGGRRPGAVAAFADWSQEGAILNKAGQDKAPDRTTTAFTP